MNCDDITLNEKFAILFDIPKQVRYIICSGGRNSSKSWTFTLWLAIMMYKYCRNIFFSRYTMTSARKSIIPEFIKKLSLLSIEDEYKINKNTVESKRQKGGYPESRIDFTGLKASSGTQTANLKGMSDYSICVVDEAEELRDEKLFDDLDFSIRHEEHQDLICVIRNPTDKNHFIDKKFFSDRGVSYDFNGVKDDTIYIHSTYLDNIDNIKPVYLAQIMKMKEKNREKYIHVFGGKPRETMEGIIFTNWKYADEQDLKDRSIHKGIFSLDFGFDHFDALMYVVNDKKRLKTYWEEKLYQKGLKTRELAALLKPIVGNNIVVCDCANPRTIDDLCEYGIKAIPVVKGIVLNEIETLKDDWNIIVCGESPNLVDNLNKYRTKKGVIVKEDDDAIDSARYGWKTLEDVAVTKVKPVKIMGIGRAR